MISFLSTLSACILLFCGGYFTCRLRAFYLVHPLRTLRALPREGRGQMLLSLGGTVGVGNILGVSVALSLGGCGAVFWMWVGAFAAMALKYAEIVLGMQTRSLGHGAAFYIRDTLGGLAGCLFACLLLCDCITMGGVIQANAIAEAMYDAFGLAPLYAGLFVCLLAAAVFCFRVDLFLLSTAVVPLMSVLYVLAALAVILCNLSALPRVLGAIVQDAFAPRALWGILLSPALRQGIVKGLFSNEAGCGTAPGAHAASPERLPARQGLFGIFEVFADTVVMCTLTALALLLTVGEGEGGAADCLRAFSSVLGGAAAPILAICIFLFAFAAIVAFGYYGVQALSYFRAGRRVRAGFLVLFCGSLLLGALAAPDTVWSVADGVVCCMLLLNTAAVFLRRRQILSAHAELLH